MDIRSIIDSEDTPANRKPSFPTPTNQDFRVSSAGYPSSQAPTYDNRRDGRPPQPSPLQTSSYNDSYFTAASPYENAGSPPQRAPSFGVNSGQYPAPHVAYPSPHYSQQVAQYQQRDGIPTPGPQSGRSFGHSTPLSQTPTASTPGSASVYSNFPRPTSSHSVPTPNSTINSSSFPRESPQPSLPQSRTSYQVQSSQQYSGQPGTPLGPPATHRRPSFNLHREHSGEHRHRRSLSGGYQGQGDYVGPSAASSGPSSAYREHQSSMPMNAGFRERERSLSVSPKTRISSLPSIDRFNYIEGSLEPDPGGNERMTPAKVKAEANGSGSGNFHDPKLTRTPSRSVGLSGLLNAEPPRESPEKIYRPSNIKNSPSNRDDSDVSVTIKNSPSDKDDSDVSITGHKVLNQSFKPQSSPSSDRTFSQPQVNSTQQPSTTPQSRTSTVANYGPSDSNGILPQQPEIASSFKMAALKTSNSLIDSPMPASKKASREPKRSKRPIHDSSEVELVDGSSTASMQPAKKKPRIEETRDSASRSSVQQEQPSVRQKKTKVPRITRWEDVPVFAQSIRGPQRTMELFQQNLSGINRGLPIAPPTVTPRPINNTNGTSRTSGPAPTQSSPFNDVSAPDPSHPDDGPLGPWEHTFTNIIPADEVTKLVADFLFPNVVLNNEVGVAPAGGGRGLGAVLEIEAKIGRLIDKNTNDRLQMPVMNECVISHTDPNLRVAFESSMTENQHRNLNQFLNKALVDSQGAKQGSALPRKSRIPMTYKHTREVDAFHEISQHGALQLPRSVASGLQLNANSRHRARVRITTDEKSGEELAKIVKTRVADIDVYSPRTLFDWRISVNVEMDFDIDMRDLVALENRDGKADRRKDRVSYKHLQYQIDLTQVTPTEPINNVKGKEHELEIEVSSEEIRKQGLRVLNSQPNGYEDLVKGFVDNVRLLARFCKE